MSRLRLTVILVVVLIATCVWFYTKRRHGSSPHVAEADPRDTFPTSILNVRPDVGYVGDGRCAECHEPQAKSYHGHPMGRSSAPMAEIASQEKYQAAYHNPFTAAGFQFQVNRRGSQVLHRETRFDAQGRQAGQFEAEVRYAIGSGTRGRSYVINRDGYLFQSAIGWYNSRGIWDLSPGFEGNPHSDKPITTECLFCHCNRVEPVENTVNRFREPIFDGYPIGCERCHGPGELHVRQRTTGVTGDIIDNTIVNPGRLEPALREAVCQQCHLQGQRRVLKRGRKPFDFRPGLPFDLFWSVFIAPAEATTALQAVGQVEQMYQSRCFAASGGRLGCISCHDAHAVPEPAERAAFYRSRCLSCHQESSCRVPGGERRKQSREDSCVSCHMPRFPSVDVAHTAVTDHRIRRRSEATAPVPAASAAALSWTLFGSDRRPSRDEESGRDYGLALVRITESVQGDRQTRLRIAEESLACLDKATVRHPDDVPALIGKAAILGILNRYPDARTALEAALALVPDREDALALAAALAARDGRHDQAIDYWQRALGLNPWNARYRRELGKVLLIRSNRAAAIQECRAALELHPFDFESRRTLVSALLQEGTKEEARKEYQKLLALEPPNADSLHRIYDPYLK
jgi:tetratricopeptide (TPR) repeat protein